MSSFLLWAGGRAGIILAVIKIKTGHFHIVERAMSNPSRP